MFLGNTLNSATSGLNSIERQLAVVAQNVANARTPNYVRESAPVSSVDSAAGPGGVRTGQATRELDIHLQANLFASVGNEASSSVTQGALEAVDQASGVPGSGQDLSSLVGALQDGFTALSAEPGSAVQQTAVLDRAQLLVDGLHSLTDTVVQTRQKAHDSLNDAVGTANTALRSIGTLSDQIIAAKASGQSTAGLEDDRDGQMKSLAQLTGAKFVRQGNGDVQVIAANSVLSTRADTGPFSLGPVNLAAGTPAAAVPPLQLNGKAVTTLGGEMGANLKLRDDTLPGMQKSLDAFAQEMAAAFQGQNVPLLTDPAGNVPNATTASGFSATIQVSSAFRATPSMLRDGANSSPGGQAGNSTNISNVLKNVFSPASGGVPSKATNLVADFAQKAAQAGSTATANTALRTGLETRFATISGVSVDSELAHMVQLQTAYAANAKVITAVQSMWSQLLDAVR